ncbi:MAG: shikimate dehydrogenase [Dokdonella sp.]
MNSVTSLLFAVFGQPVSHSRSPQIHTAFARQFGLSVDYRRIESDNDSFAESLAAFARDGGLGANVTLPLKESAASLCSELSPRARRAGSINTLSRRGEDWIGDSTDGEGLLADLRNRHGVELGGARVLIVGAGGAARAAAATLIDTGIGQLTVANRNLSRAQRLCAEIDPLGRSIACDIDALENHGAVDLLINATSAGHGGEHPALRGKLISKDAVVYDLSYGKAAHPFLDWAQSAGAARTFDGLGMLVEQAAASFAIWHGVHPVTEPVYRAQRESVDRPS